MHKAYFMFLFKSHCLLYFIMYYNNNNKHFFIKNKIIFKYHIIELLPKINSSLSIIINERD